MAFGAALVKNTSLYSLVHSGGGRDDPELTDDDKAAMIEGAKRSYDAVLALQKTGRLIQRPITRISLSLSLSFSLFLSLSSLSLSGSPLSLSLCLLSLSLSVFPVPQ